VSHPTLSQLSRKRLSECHPDLQRLVELASSRLPLAVIQGHRNEADQNAAFDRGNSKLRWPKSRHNSLPAEAVDLVPQPLDWNNISRFEELGRVVKQAALDLGIEIDWGGDWKKFRDYPHFELRRK
jgi:peptidoglycan LD-endopeptidase CwlK